MDGFQMKKMIKFALALGSILGYIFCTALLLEKYYMFLYGEHAVFYTGNNLFALQILAFLIFLGLMAYLWTKGGLADPAYGSEEGIRSEQKPRQKAVITAAAAAVLLAVNLFAAHWYDRITPEGVELHHLFRAASYSWDDVDYYRLDTQMMDDTLSMKLVMKDGRTVEVLPPVLSTESDGFDVGFEEGIYDFLPWLNSRLIEKNKRLKIKEEKELLQRLHKYAANEELAEKIIESCRRAGTY